MGWSNLGSFVSTEEFILLSEGLADRTFFEKLMEAGRIPRFDCPWPVDVTDGNIPDSQKNMAGLSGFVHMLRMFNRFRTLKPEETAKTKGILIVADARDDRDDTFRIIRQQIRDASKFGEPTGVLEMARSPDGHPAIAVLLIPLAGQGSLETLCLQQLIARHVAVAQCLDAYMGCEGVAASIQDWTTEKTEKAKLQSLVAVTNGTDPNKTIRRLFSTTDSTEARINVCDASFSPICDAVSAFCAAASA